MSSHVISHQEPHGKRAPSRQRYRVRGSWWSYFARRFGALVVTIIALGVASFLAPLVRPPAPAAPVVASAPQAPVAEPQLQEIDVALDLAGPPPAQQRRERRVRSGIPLDAAGVSQADGYEILSAAELDAISQARN
jgi:hypothetical protein